MEGTSAKVPAYQGSGDVDRLSVVSQAVEAKGVAQTLIADGRQICDYAERLRQRSFSAVLEKCIKDLTFGYLQKD